MIESDYLYNHEPADDARTMVLGSCSKGQMIRIINDYKKVHLCNQRGMARLYRLKKIMGDLFGIKKTDNRLVFYLKD